MFERAGVVTTGLAFLALTLAGCAVDDDFENLTGATGTVTFCVQDENNVNFNGVFVNFGNIEINQATNLNVEHTDVATDDTAGTDATDTADTAGTGTTATDGTTASPTDTADTNTTAATTDTEGNDTTTTDTDTATAGPEDEGEPARTIQVADIECVRTEGADFDIGDVDARGQAYGNDRTADTNDAQTDDDEGIGNDDNGRGVGRDDDGETERVNVEVEELDLLEFQDRNAAFLAEARVKPGTFRNVMIDVESVRVTTEDGDDREIEVDVKKIHLKGPIEVREDQNTLVVFKVDLERSIVSTGSGDVRFKPVLHVQVTAPQVQEIVIHETTTVTTTATNETTTDTMTTGDTMTTTTGTETATATATATQTTSPTATTTSPSPT